MKRARVLIVDDAMLIRRLVTDALAAEPAIDVVGDAADGRAALQKIAQLQPDLVTLDVEMPGMDGISVLREIRKSHPRLPVIMFSALTERGASDTLEALHIGASDYVTKPSSAAGKLAALDRIRGDLVPKIRSLCHVDEGQRAATPRFTMRALGSPTRAEVVVIALSTGGPAALTTIVSALQADFPAPILVVQHMQKMFTRFLADRLNGQTPLAVVEAIDGQVIQPGTVYLAPGDAHLAVRKQGNQTVTDLTQDPAGHAHKPAADVLFCSAAAAYGARAVGVVLTGMGEDALRGSEAIARAGGRVLVQDEATSMVWEMPGRVARAGFADAVLPVGEIAGELVKRTKKP